MKSVLLPSFNISNYNSGIIKWNVSTRTLGFIIFYSQDNHFLTKVYNSYTVS